MAVLEIKDAVTGLLRAASTADLSGQGGSSLITTAQIYKATATTAEYTIDDTIRRLEIIDLIANTTTISWTNITTSAVLTTTPPATDLQLQNGGSLTDAELRASPVGVKSQVVYSPPDSKYVTNAEGEVVVMVVIDADGVQTPYFFDGVTKTLAASAGSEITPNPDYLAGSLEKFFTAPSDILDNTQEQYTIPMTGVRTSLTPVVSILHPFAAGAVVVGSVLADDFVTFQITNNTGSTIPQASSLLIRVKQ